MYLLPRAIYHLQNHVVMLFASHPVNEVKPTVQREYEISNELGLHHLHTSGRELITDLSHVMEPGSSGKRLTFCAEGLGSDTVGFSVNCSILYNRLPRDLHSICLWAFCDGHHLYLYRNTCEM
jgi:hypothetical protein